jgi:hypothetical protein
MVRRSLVFLFVLLMFAVPLSASADSTTTISGSVTNATPGGGAVSGLTVTLDEYQGMDLAKSFTSKTDSSGHYQFDNMPVLEGEAYIARVSYKNVDYPGTMLLMPQDAGKTDTVKVYETSTDPATVTLDSRSIVVAGADPGQRLISLFEILAIDNKTDHTFIGNNGVVLRLGLPDSSAQITPQPGFDFGDAKIDGGTLVTTGAIIPGSQTALISYEVPYTGTTKDITIGTAMPTGTERFLVKDGTFDLSSSVFNDAGLVDVSGDKYHVLSVDKPIVGDTLSVQILNLPKAGSSGDSSNGPLYAAIAAGVGVLLAAGLVFFTLRRRSRKNSSAANSTPEGAVASASRSRVGGYNDERLVLAAQLNQLDERHADGTISDEAYQSDRQRVLDELRVIARRQRGLEDVEA